MWLLVCSQAFPKIWPSDLLVEPTKPILGLVRNFFKANIWSKFEVDWVKIEASTVFISKLLTYDARRRTPDIQPYR